MRTRFKYWNWGALVPQLLAVGVLFVAIGWINDNINNVWHLTAIVAWAVVTILVLLFNHGANKG